MNCWVCGHEGEETICEACDKKLDEYHSQCQKCGSGSMMVKTEGGDIKLKCLKCGSKISMKGAVQR